jgi:hypothetical protein
MLYFTHTHFPTGILCFLTLSIFCIENKISTKTLCFRDSICLRPQAKNTVKTYSGESNRQSYKEETTWKTKVLMAEQY